MLHRIMLAALVVIGVVAAADARPALKVVVLGDSLSAGYQLPADAAFPAVLEKALRRAGVDVEVANAGVSGDTAQAGLERLDWSVPDGTDGVILELGANDMLRGLDPGTTGKTLQAIIDRLTDRHIRVFLAGMLATPSLGYDYVARFDALYPTLAKANELPLYPFFLDGVAQDRALRQADGMHPTATGVDVIVKRITPALLIWLRSFPGEG